MCLARGITRAATVADHIIPHRGDADLFWNGKLQSLCATCHSKLKQREEIHGHTELLDDDGWPSDPRHPANVGTGASPGVGGVKSLETLEDRQIGRAHV